MIADISGPSLQVRCGLLCGKKLLFRKPIPMSASFLLNLTEAVFHQCIKHRTR